MHDGSVVRFTRTPADYDPTDRSKVAEYLDSHMATGEVLTGLLFLDESSADMHELSNSTEVPMAHIPYETLCPGSAVLDKLQDEYR
jgi:2-oxoglutarate ferredoxin oxidoreductase subunit beta